ncbi:hypothetical protein N9W89_05510 [Hellea sp.]|nr:hypothetical protein [Hellea sp.]
MARPDITKGDLRWGSNTDVSRFRSNLANVKSLSDESAMGKKRLFFTVLTLLVTAFLAYSSWFYFPAYTINPATIHVASHSHLIPSSDVKVDDGVLDNYVKLLAKQRGYLKAGQSVTASYKVSAGTMVDLVVSSCSNYVILEIYKCNKVVSDSVKIGSAPEGKIDFTVESSGFYVFDEILSSPHDEATQYQISWRRQ